MTDKTDVMRGEFEAWLASEMNDPEPMKKRNGDYLDPETRNLESAWQAALQSPVVRKLVETACNAEKIIRNCVNAGQVNAGYLQHANDLDKALANFASISRLPEQNEQNEQRDSHE